MHRLPAARNELWGCTRASPMTNNFNSWGYLRYCMHTEVNRSVARRFVVARWEAQVYCRGATAKRGVEGTEERFFFKFMNGRSDHSPLSKSPFVQVCGLFFLQRLLRNRCPINIQRVVCPGHDNPTCSMWITRHWIMARMHLRIYDDYSVLHAAFLPFLHILFASRAVQYNVSSIGKSQ